MKSVPFRAIAENAQISHKLDPPVLSWIQIESELMITLLNHLNYWTSPVSRYSLYFFTLSCNTINAEYTGDLNNELGFEMYSGGSNTKHVWILNSWGFFRCHLVFFCRVSVFKWLVLFFKLFRFRMGSVFECSVFEPPLCLTNGDHGHLLRLLLSNLN